jgi:hypothetical protein
MMTGSSHRLLLLLLVDLPVGTDRELVDGLETVAVDGAVDAAVDGVLYLRW